MADHPDIRYRVAQPADVPSMRKLILEHGPNPWNHLPKDGVNRHLDNVEQGREWAMTAWVEGELIGFMSYRVGRIFPQYEPESSRDTDHGYIVEGVVNRDHIGSGIGKTLLEAAKSRLREQGVRVVYADRHEENIRSAGPRGDIRCGS